MLAARAKPLRTELLDSPEICSLMLLPNFRSDHSPNRRFTRVARPSGATFCLLLTRLSRTLNIISVANQATWYITHRRRAAMINLGKVSVETRGFKQSKGEGTGEVLI
jgi:hypothetical protein